MFLGGQLQLAVLVVLSCSAGAFVVPSGLSGRSSPSAIRLSNSSPIRQQQQRQQAPGMVLSGLPSPSARKKTTISDPKTTKPPAEKKARSSSTWNDDFGTTVGRAAFASLKNKARDMMVKGAEKRGLDWTGIVEGLKGAENWEKRRTEILAKNTNVVVPEYYLKQFHAYGDGNLCWQAAFEQEIASLAVGIRSFPKEGLNAEKYLRDAYIAQLTRLGGQVEKGGVIVDFGCGVGTSTRLLAESMPGARRVIGMDLSPYMIAVGNHHNREKKTGRRVSLVYGDVADTRLPDGGTSLVSCTYLLHEMPDEAVRDVLAEAYRLLKPGGSLAIMDMDPDAPGYKKLRSNPFLFAIVRATEPYLDQWFNLAPRIHHLLAETGFSVVRKAAVTGRHFLVVATKAGSLDLRPSDRAREAMDEHLSTWQT
ncbi:unnamed protein product [Ectocarpus sp. CCAP 1310/34]|nr:unnamed protein product [Ectocarpus sp. CCAP 1310/34]